MAHEDKIKWDNKYLNNANLLEKRPPSKILKEYISNAPSNNALDLACGSGRNSIFLAQNGFSVDSIDISTIALDHLKNLSANLDINPLLADLDSFTPDKSYDLILMINFLDRDLIKRAKEWLNKDAIFIVETYMRDKANQKQNSNPDFLLKSGELKEIFKEFDIIEYREFYNEPHELYRMKKSSIVAKRL